MGKNPKFWVRVRFGFFDLHWLRIRERITFKLCVMCQMPTQPGTSLSVWSATTGLASMCQDGASDHQVRHHSSSHWPEDRRLATERFQFPPPEHGSLSLPSTAAPTLSSFHRALKLIYLLFHFHLDIQSVAVAA